MDKLLWSWWSWLLNSHNQDEDEEMIVTEGEIIIKENELITEEIATTSTATAAIDHLYKDIKIISKLLPIVNNNDNENDTSNNTTTTDNFLRTTSNILSKFLNTSYISSSTSRIRTTTLSALTDDTVRVTPLMRITPSASPATTIIPTDITNTTTITDQIITNYSTIPGPDYLSKSSSPVPKFVSSLLSSSSPFASSSKTPLPSLSSPSTTTSPFSRRTSIVTNLTNTIKSEINNTLAYHLHPQQQQQQTTDIKNDNDYNSISLSTLFKGNESISSSSAAVSSSSVSMLSNNSSLQYSVRNITDVLIKSSNDGIFATTSSLSSLQNNNTSSSLYPSTSINNNNDIAGSSSINIDSSHINDGSLSSISSGISSKILDYDMLYDNYTSLSSSSSSSSSSSLASSASLITSSSSEYGSSVGGYEILSDVFNSYNSSNFSLSINQTTINTINLEEIYNNNNNINNSENENFLLDILINCSNSLSLNLTECCSNRSSAITTARTSTTSVTDFLSSIGGSSLGLSNSDNGMIGISYGLITINIGGHNQTVNCSSFIGAIIPSSSSTSSTSSSSTTVVDDYFFGAEYDIDSIIQIVTTFGTAIVLGIIILATVIGNVFVIAAILLERNLQSVSNYLILSLAVADLLVACLVMPLSAVYEVSQEWKLGPELCDMWTSSDVLCCTASILHLVAIALDRYWAVTNIDYIHQRTARRIGIMILIIWALSFLVSVAPLLGWKDPKWDERVSRELKCIVSQDIGYQIFATASSFYVPLLVILILYWRIFQTARKRIRRRQQAACQTHPEPLMANASCLPLTGIGFRWKVTATPPASGGLIATAAGGSGGIAAAVVTVIGRPLPTISETTTAFTNISSTHTSPEKGSYGNGMDRIENDPPTADISTCGTGPPPSSVATTAHGKQHGGGGILSTTSIRPKIVRKKTQTSVDSKRERKAAKTLAIITGAFVCCWLPFFALAILLPICQCYIPPIVMSLSLWLGYFNSTLNPIIYTIFSPEFRHAFKRLLCGRRNSIRRQNRCVRR